MNFKPFLCRRQLTLSHLTCQTPLEKCCLNNTDLIGCPNKLFDDNFIGIKTFLCDWKVGV